MIDDATKQTWVLGNLDGLRSNAMNIMSNAMRGTHETHEAVGRDFELRAVLAPLERKLYEIAAEARTIESEVSALLEGRRHATQKVSR